MPVPKKRHSNCRTNKRRANWKVKPVNYGLCPACSEPILSHTACKSCGAYQGRQVIDVDKKKDKKKEK